MLRALLLATCLATPALAEDVNIYSYNQSERMQPLFDAFTAQTGIKVNIVYSDTGLINRLIAEGARSPADLVMTVDISRLAELKAANVLQSLTDPALIDAIPAQFRDADNLWIGLTMRGRVIYAAKDRVAPGEVTTYEDLADPKWQGRLCTRSGLADYNLALTAAMIAHHGEAYTKTWLEGVKANLARKPEGNDTSQAKAIAAGQCDIALGNTYYIGQMMEDPELKADAEAVRLDFPVFEGSGTHVNISGIGMTKSAPHPENAVKLMEFLVSPEGQAIYGSVNAEYPLVAGAEISPVMQGWPALTPDTIPLLDIATYRADALRLMEEVNFDG